MKAEVLEEIVSWFKSTDLSEATYREMGDGFSLTKAEAQPQLPTSQLPNRYLAAASPSIGLFYFSEPGRARTADEGAPVTEGQVLGFVELAKGRREAVKSPAAGRLARVMVEEGEAVDYGRPLFFIETP